MSVGALLQRIWHARAAVGALLSELRWPEHTAGCLIGAFPVLTCWQ